VDIAEDRLPAEPAPDRAPMLGRRGWVVFGLILGAMLAATAVAGFFLKVPYYALMPGSTRDTRGAIVLEGATVYPSEGEVLFTTVRVRGRLSIWQYLWLQRDGDVEVVPEVAVLGDRDRDENRQYNRQLMDNSKQVAVAVALGELGYEVTRPTGVLVVSVVADSAADGLLEPGDVITEVDGLAVLDAPALVELLGDRQPGSAVLFTIERHQTGEVDVVSVVLGEHPDGAGAFLGIQPSTRLDFGPLPFEVSFDTGEVGGPSAGLAFTLALLEDLTPGELTGGDRVAVTGTVAIDGSVGPVGGVAQKAAAVREAGVAVFLVPAALSDAELARVRERAGPRTEVVPVGTVEEAIAVLASLGGGLDGVAAGALVTN
jgi:Lon-like protease